jgi:hypothetical protein
VPTFRQGDAAWRDDPLGGVLDNGTLGSAGDVEAFSDGAIAILITIMVLELKRHFQ